MKNKKLITKALIFLLLFVCFILSFSYAITPLQFPTPDTSVLPDSDLLSEGNIIISILSPEDNTIINPGVESFSFNLDANHPGHYYRCHLVFSGPKTIFVETHDFLVGNNTINATIPDYPGSYDWYISCNSYIGNTYISNVSEVRTFAVDATYSVLNITLLEPINGTKVRPGNIKFIYDLENTSAISKCDFYINGTKITSQTPKDGRNVIASYFADEYQGTYEWYVECFSDEGSNKSQTEKFEVTTDIPETRVETADLVTDKKTYYPGSNVIIEGSLFSPSSEVNLELKTNKVLDKKSFYASIFGTFTEKYVLPLSISEGNYTFYAENKNNKTQNATAGFEVLMPIPLLFLSKTNPQPGDSIIIRGYHFLPTTNILISFKINGNTIATNKTNISDAGEFNITYNIPYNVYSNITVEAVTQGFGDVKASKIIIVNDNPLPIDESNETGNETAIEDYAGSDDFSDDSGSEDINEDINDGSGIDDNTTIGSDNSLLSGDDKPSSESEPSPEDIIVNRHELDNKPKKKSIWGWILLLVVVAIIGGFIGFLYYEGNLDLSSPQDFIDGIRDALRLNQENNSISGIVSQPPPLISDKDFQILSSFISSERSKGYDDLTIRNALIKKGWSEPEVDAVFDRIYRDY